MVKAVSLNVFSFKGINELYTSTLERHRMHKGKPVFRFIVHFMVVSLAYCFIQSLRAR